MNSSAEPAAPPGKALLVTSALLGLTLWLAALSVARTQSRNRRESIAVSGGNALVQEFVPATPLHCEKRPPEVSQSAAKEPAVPPFQVACEFSSFKSSSADWTPEPWASSAAVPVMAASVAWFRKAP